MQKKKKKGYILLLTMIILSSLSILLLTIIRESQIYFNLNKAYARLYNNKKYILDAIAIIKDLLLVNKDKKSNNQESRTKDSNAKITDFVKFYWGYCNRWLEYTIFNELQNIDAKIRIYITFADGKIPLAYPINLFEKEKQKNNESENNIDNVNENILKNSHELNQFLEILKLFEKDENSLFNKIFLFDQSNEENRKKLIISNILTNYMKKTSHLPTSISSFYQAVCDENETKNINQKIYQYQTEKSLNDKKKSISDCCSFNNEKINLLYISPTLLSILANKEIPFNDEIKNKIIQDIVEFIKSKSSIDNQQFWNSVIEKNFKIPFPTNFFENPSIKKITSTELLYPQSIEIILQITILNKDSFILVNFEKNSKYDKTNEEGLHQNQEYLLNSIQVLPNQS